MSNVCPLLLRSDDDDGSGSKYGRLDPSEDNMQDKERFAR